MKTTRLDETTIIPARDLDYLFGRAGQSRCLAGAVLLACLSLLVWFALLSRDWLSIAGVVALLPLICWSAGALAWALAIASYPPRHLTCVNLLRILEQRPVMLTPVLNALETARQRGQLTERRVGRLYLDCLHLDRQMLSMTHQPDADDLRGARYGDGCLRLAALLGYRNPCVLLFAYPLAHDKIGRPGNAIA